MSDYQNLHVGDFEDHRWRRAHLIVCPCANRRVAADDAFQFIDGQIANCQIHSCVPLIPSGINKNISWIGGAVNDVGTAERVNFLH